MAKGPRDDLKLLDTVVDCLMAGSHSLPHCHLGSVVLMDHARGRLDSMRILSHVSIICFNPLTLVKAELELFAKDCDVGPVATREGSVDPNNITRQDTDA